MPSCPQKNREKKLIVFSFLLQKLRPGNPIRKMPSCPPPPPCFLVFASLGKLTLLAHHLFAFSLTKTPAFGNNNWYSSMKSQLILFCICLNMFAIIIDVCFCDATAKKLVRVVSGMLGPDLVTLHTNTTHWYKKLPPDYNQLQLGLNHFHRQTHKGPEFISSQLNLSSSQPPKLQSSSPITFWCQKWGSYKIEFRSRDDFFMSGVSSLETGHPSNPNFGNSNVNMNGASKKKHPRARNRF